MVVVSICVYRGTCGLGAYMNEALLVSITLCGCNLEVKLEKNLWRK